ncbi:glycoside hydrolase family 65 protein [Sunxiuqinia indica]|uniref:hypothetical protein n=1 Tax=Sunxiuqinia indica TaxID=2692584 RepID=UPI00135872A3|nr:hypothetical protein [Sunxiuqinia indica]
MKQLIQSSLYLLLLFLWSCNNGSSLKSDSIDRFALVTRHNVHLQEIDPLAPLTLGNGDFAYTLDVTGLQSFENYYYENGVPLETRTTWTWHAFPNTNNLTLEDAMKESDFHGRKIKYASNQNSPAGDYFRINPHPVPMGKIGLVDENNQSLERSSIKQIDQVLDLWQGLANSQYQVDGQPVSVETVCHPTKSIIAFRIESSLIESGKLRPSFHFPYSYDFSLKNKPAFDWKSTNKHLTEVAEKSDNHVLLKRAIDSTSYWIDIRWENSGEWNKVGSHEFTIDAKGSDHLVLVCEFLPTKAGAQHLSFDDIKQMSADSWQTFWTEGAAVDLSESTDPRADELERRIVLSQYLMKVNYSGSFPPQESGLSNISWYGKHNSEVYWIHAAQFYQWNHTELLEKGLSWYGKILPAAQADAQSKGFEGARWPKMSGIDGRVSPGTINPFIIWNHPNPIYLSELVYRAHKDSVTLHRYKDIVFESAKFLASYAYYDPETDRYILGPPIKSVNESTEENTTMNPTFELTQWYHGLSIAQQWRERLNMERDSLWDDILDKLARPTMQNGKYVELESDPSMYDRDGNYSSAMLMALGYLPKTPMIDEQIMRNTFEAIYERNGLESFVSWSQGKGALTAARLGDTKKAIDIVCNDVPKAKFNKSGYVCRPKEGIKNPAYLPVNGSFLAAIGLMAGGWDGAPDVHAPGFPKDGTWKVKTENLQKLP